MEHAKVKISNAMFNGQLALDAAPPPPKVTAEFRELLKQIKEAGLYCHHANIKMFLWVAFIVSIGVGIFYISTLITPSLLSVMVLAFCCGLHTVHVAFLGHDFAHKTGFSSQRLNRFFAELSWIYTGNGLDVWYASHNLRHHVHCMNVEADSLIQSPVFANHRFISNKQFIKRWNYILVYPLAIAFGALKFQYEGFAKNLSASEYTDYTGKSADVNLLRRALTLFSLFALLIFRLFFIYMISAGQIHLFVAGMILFHIGIGVMYSLAFLPNHHHPDVVVLNSNSKWAKQQITTSQSISGGSFIALLISPCLKYQIEHHLFPNVSSWNFKKIQPYVKAFAEKYHYQYLETNLFKAQYYVIKSLRYHSKD